MNRRQCQVLDAIEAFHREYGYAPTVREVGELVGLRSSATIHAHLTHLRARGIVDWVDGQNRTLHLVKAAA